MSSPVTAVNSSLKMNTVNWTWHALTVRSFRYSKTVALSSGTTIYLTLAHEGRR